MWQRALSGSGGGGSTTTPDEVVYLTTRDGYGGKCGYIDTTDSKLSSALPDSGVINQAAPNFSQNLTCCNYVGAVGPKVNITAHRDVKIDVKYFRNSTTNHQQITLASGQSVAVDYNDWGISVSGDYIGIIIYTYSA